MQLLPRYCPDTQVSQTVMPAQIPEENTGGHGWDRLFGHAPLLLGAKHYEPCRESWRIGIDRHGAWESARGDLGYVIDNSAPDFIMLPEIYTRLGDVQLLLKKPNRAKIAFAKARELKPDYWPAYSHWAEFLMNIGRRPEALKIVASGLAYSPDAKVLLEQFRLLGGKPSDIPRPAKKPARDY